MVLTGILVNTFAHRNCDAFIMDATVPCQTVLDYVFFLGAALGAGMALRDERLAFVGFVVAHVVGSIFFVVVLAIPILLGLTDPVVALGLSNISLKIVFYSQFPVALLVSFFGAILGMYLGEKMGL